MGRTLFDIKDKQELKILEGVNLEFGEIGNFLVKDGYVSFEVYRGYYENAPKFLQTIDGEICLKLVDKFDDRFFTLVYKMLKDKNKHPSTNDPQKLNPSCLPLQALHPRQRIAGVH